MDTEYVGLPIFGFPDAEDHNAWRQWRDMAAGGIQAEKRSITDRIAEIQGASAFLSLVISDVL